MAQTAVRVLSVGLETEICSNLSEYLRQPKVDILASAEAFETATNDLADGMYDVIMCGSVSMGVPPTELAQAFKALCPNTPLLFISTSTAEMKVKVLNKNGFEKAFLLPVDRPLLVETLVKIEHAVTGSSRRLYRGVALIDVAPGDPLNFDVSIFLPMNNKYVKVISEGKSLTPDKFEKFKHYQVSKVFVDSTKMQEFYKYTAEKLKALNTPGGKLSETERQEKLKDSLRGILMNVFDTSSEATFEDGREIMNDTQEVISEMIGLKGTLDIQKELMKALSQPSQEAGRSGRVSTLAALFEMAVGLKLTQQAAIAGMFMDLGMACLPVELQTKDPKTMTPEERALYEAHPATSLRLLQGKRIVIPPDIQNAILNHHERVDGSGFPGKLVEAKISPLTQIVALADRFEELTFGPNRPTDMQVIINKLRDEKICSADILRKVSVILLKNQKAAA